MHHGTAAIGRGLGGLALISPVGLTSYRGTRVRDADPCAAGPHVPVAGIVVAVCAAAGPMSAIALTSRVARPPGTRRGTWLLYAENRGAVLASMRVGVVFRPRTSLLHLLGMASLTPGSS